MHDREFFRNNPGRRTYIRYASDDEQRLYGCSCKLAMVVRKIDDTRRLSLFLMVPPDARIPDDEESCSAIFDGIWKPATRGDMWPAFAGRIRELGLWLLCLCLQLGAKQKHLNAP